MNLYRQMHPDDPTVEDGSDLETYREILANSRLHLLVLEIDGAVVATTYLNVMPNLTRSASRYAVIENVVVDVSLRRSGLGRRIMDATLEKAWGGGLLQGDAHDRVSRPGNARFLRSLRVFSRRQERISRSAWTRMISDHQSKTVPGRSGRDLEPSGIGASALPLGFSKPPLAMEPEWMSMPRNDPRGYGLADL